MNQLNFKYVIFDCSKHGAESFIGISNKLENAHSVAMGFIKNSLDENVVVIPDIQIMNVFTGTIRTYKPSVKVNLQEV